MCLSFFLSSCLFAEEQNLSIEVYVNQSVPEKNYSLSDIRAIFAMRKSYWSNGKKIHVFVMADDVPLHRQFTKKKLSMFPHQLRRIWDRLIFSGIGQAPETVHSIEEMLNKISTTPGAIGYLIKQSNDTNIRMISYE